VQSVIIEPLGGGVQVTLRLAGPAAVLAADVVEEHVRPAVERMWDRVPRRAADLCLAVADAQHGLAEMESSLRRAEALAEAQQDAGLPADSELAQVLDLRHRVGVRKQAVKGLRSRAEDARAQARRDLRNLTAMARAEILEEMAARARAAWEKLACAVAGPLEELLAARTAWAGVVGSVEAAADRLEDLLPVLPPPPPEPRHVTLPPGLERPRHGYFHPELNVFVEGELPRPQPEPVGQVSEAAKAKVAAELAYQSRSGYLDEKDRFHEGPPPPAGTTAPPLVPSFDNTPIPRGDEQAKADQAAKQMAAQWVAEFDEAKRQAEAEALPAAPELPVAPELPAAPVVLPPPPLPGVSDPPGPPKRNRRS
jgi:hypothetical protein